MGFPVSIPLEQGNVFRHVRFGLNELIVGVSIPLEQGNVFRQTEQEIQAVIQVSIPLEQGNVFRQNITGDNYVADKVSIPLEQGNVFRPDELAEIMGDDSSQSLWNRAMSSDLIKY